MLRHDGRRESVRELAGLGLDDDPWVGRELVAIIDFPDLNVPPGTRRGVMPDAAADALVAALDALRPRVLRELGAAMLVLARRQARRSLCPRDSK